MLEQFDDTDKQKYISENLGTNVIGKVQRIHRGGENATKGQKKQQNP